MDEETIPPHPLEPAPQALPDDPAQGEGAGNEPPSNEDSSAEPVLKIMPATMVLIMVILLVYGITALPHGFMKADPLALALGAFDPASVSRGQYWRFITATLLHVDLSHVFNNVFGLYIFGRLLEPALGARRMLLLFIVSAVWGLLFSYFLVPAPTVGASTINYGEIGCYIALILLFRYRTDRAMFLRELRAAVIFTGVFVAWNVMDLGTVNLWGHVGGFIAGLLFGYWVYEKHRKRTA